MAFIRYSNLGFTENGDIKTGSASILVSQYVANQKHHSKQITRELLGRVYWVSEDKKSGIFESPTRGLVEYNSITDKFVEASYTDPRIKREIKKVAPQQHVNFGSIYALLEFMQNNGYIDLLHDFANDKSFYEKLMCHTCHDILKNTGRDPCDSFINQTILSHLIENKNISCYESDTAFYTKMADDDLKISFFQKFVQFMKKRNKNFGSCAYVDTTPLKNDIKDNPLNALCCHGVDSCCVQTRLALVLDESTGLPIWFSLIPGNVLDLSTISTIREEVYLTLGLEISSLVLDAGYVSQENLNAFASNESFCNVMLRMPSRRGYPYKELYHKVKPKINRIKYRFVRNEHSYFGCKEKVNLFGNDLYAYVYVDFDNAEMGLKKFIVDKSDEFKKMLDKDKDFLGVKNGYFVLISNKDKNPCDVLDEYFSRTQIEIFFKTSKEYLNLLPIRKWSSVTMRGKLFHDIINTIIYQTLRSTINSSNVSLVKAIADLRSLHCLCSSNGRVIVDMPNKGCKQAMKVLKVEMNLNKSLDWYKARYKM